MEDPTIESATRDHSPRPTLFARALRWAVAHVLELCFLAFVLVFAAVLRFEDQNNLEIFLRAASYLVVGRNPYAIIPFPAPPGLFLPTLPAFGVYALSGYSLAWATFTLKVFNAVALLGLSAIVTRLALFRGVPGVTARSIGIALLLSPLAFFVSFVWVEQDAVGLTLALAGLWAVLSSAQSPRPARREGAGFALIVVSAFMFYFPITLLPALIVYSSNLREAVRRVVWSSVAFGVLGLWFLVEPGWWFSSNAVSVTGANGNVSIYSVVTLLGPGLFVGATAFQTMVVAVLFVLFVILELVVPVLLRLAHIPLEVAVAVAITLPFLLLNIENGDEFVWPLPFLLLAICTTCAGPIRSLYLWLIQAYAIPIVLLVNMFDAPGPGAGSGVFYFAYPQFGNAVTIYPLIPHYSAVAEACSLLTWLGLLALIGTLLWLGHRSAHRTSGDVAERPSEHGSTPPRARFWSLGHSPDSSNPPWGRPRPSLRTRRAVAVSGVLAAAVVITVLSATVASPTLTASRSDTFPLGFFTQYAVANSSVTYRVSSTTDSITVAPNYGNWTVLSSPWRTVNFSRDVEGEHLDLGLKVGVTAPTDIPFNTTVFAYGNSGLNVVRPFAPPSSAGLLAPLASANVTPAGPIESPQIAGTLSGGLVFNGSSYARYDAIPLTRPSGQVTLLFRWSGVSLPENVVLTLYRGNVTYQLYGSNDVYVAGEKPSLNGTWTFLAPRLVNPLSWHELSITNESNGTELTLDGTPFALPPVPASSERQGADLFVGAADANPQHFQTFNFWGTIAGPFNTTDVPPALEATQWCEDESGDGGSAPVVCSPFLTAPISLQAASGELVVQTGAQTFRLDSTPPLFQLGRLSQVGPQLTFEIESLSIRSSLSLFPLVWVLDGVGLSVVMLLVLVATTAPKVSAGSPGRAEP